MNIKVLQYVIDYEHEHLLDAVAGSRTSLEVATGVAKLLIANNGDPTVLKGKQLDVYEECIKPVFIVACSGINGDDTCSGTGWVDGESLLISYQEDEFLCQHCRFDAQRIASE
jgi:hypothetical protein